MSAAELIESIPAANGPVTLTGTENWRQGRTMYGGASALIAYTAAIRAFPDLPPLRAAQIGFVAPIAEEIELRSEMIRQGRNVAQLRTEILSEGKVALTAFWLFGTGRDANAQHDAAEVSPWPGKPEDANPLPSENAPAFIQNNFDIRRAQDVSGPGEPVVRRWIKLKETTGLDPVSDLVLLGDTLPPGAMRAMQRQGPISSINWSFNVLDPQPATSNGWWLSENASDHADHGYSSERLRMWNSQGKQMLSGIQSVAIFG